MWGKSETNGHFHRRFPIVIPSDNHVIAEMDFSRSDTAVLTAILCTTLYIGPRESSILAHSTAMIIGSWYVRV